MAKEIAKLKETSRSCMYADNYKKVLSPQQARH